MVLVLKFRADTEGDVYKTCDNSQAIFRMLSGRLWMLMQKRWISRARNVCGIRTRGGDGEVCARIEGDGVE